MITNDPYVTIEQIQNLSGNHHTSVKKLLESVEALEATTNTEPSLAGIEDPARIPDLVREHAEFVSMNQSVPGVTVPQQGNEYGTAVSVGSPAPIYQAKTRIASALKHKLVAAVRDNQDYYINQYRGIFDAAAESYTTAVNSLPTEFDPASAMDFSDEQFSAYKTAKQAVATLKTVRAFLRNLPEVTGQLRMDNAVSADLLIVDPHSVAGFNAVQFPEQPANATVAHTAPHLRAALAAGAEFRMSTAAEAVATYREYENN